MTHYIVFIADVQVEQVGRLRRAITDAVNGGATQIYIAISSGGGSVSEGLAIAALIKGLSAEVITHNIGQTDSVANVIYAAGGKRYATPNASFMFHGVTQQFTNQNMTESQVHEVYKLIVRARETIAQNFSAYTGLPLVDVTKLMVDGANILSATEALAKAIVHDVREFSIPSDSQITTIGNA